MDLENMRRRGDHIAASANFLAAYKAGDGEALWQAIVYCAGHRVPLYRPESICFSGVSRQLQAEIDNTAAPPRSAAPNSFWAKRLGPAS
jgi:hypothetical protein